MWAAGTLAPQCSGEVEIRLLPCLELHLEACVDINIFNENMDLKYNCFTILLLQIRLTNNRTINGFSGIINYNNFSSQSHYHPLIIFFKILSEITNF